MPDIEKNGYNVPYQLIQGGCKELGTNTWKYEFEDRNGPQIYVFLTVGDDIPQIGDRIENGVLVKKTEPLINNDPGFQNKDHMDYTWPEDYKG